MAEGDDPLSWHAISVMQRRERDRHRRALRLQRAAIALLFAIAALATWETFRYLAAQNGTR